MLLSNAESFGPGASSSVNAKIICHLVTLRREFCEKKIVSGIFNIRWLAASHDGCNFSLCLDEDRKEEEKNLVQ
jgi:hypothetical protein